MATRIMSRTCSKLTGSSCNIAKTVQPKTNYYLKPDRRHSTWQRYAKMGFIGSSVAVGIGVLGLGYNYDGLEDEYSDLAIPIQIPSRAVGTIKDKIISFCYGSDTEPLLPDTLPYPYQAPYTLVIELADILVAHEYSRQRGWVSRKRQGINVFLENLCQYYEVVIFTTDDPNNAFHVIQAIDPKMCILYKLYKDSLSYKNGKNVKDLSRLNRDLSKVIMVDVNRDSVSQQPENALILPRWRGETDLDLLDLADMLIVIAKEERPKDIRTAIKCYTELDDPIGAYKLRKREIIDNEKRRKAEMIAKHSKSTFGGKKWW